MEKRSLVGAFEEMTINHTKKMKRGSESFEETKSSQCFCLEESCNFSGPPKSLLDHVNHVHQIPVQEFNYSTEFKVTIPSSSEYTFLTAKDDGNAFLLWSRNLFARLLWVVGVGPPSLRGTKLKFEIKTEGCMCKRADCVYVQTHIKKEGPIVIGVVKNTRLENGKELPGCMMSLPYDFQHPISRDLNVRLCIGINFP